jgi:hypothetical protein
MTGRPRFLLCEDGSEYLERFERFLGARFEFVQSRSFSALISQLERHQPIAGILLDLDFRRTDASRLVDSEGQPISHSSEQERARLVSNQGIAILASLRRVGCCIPVLLFADIEDQRQREYLEAKFAPLELIASHVGLNELHRRLEELARGQRGSGG